MTSNNLIGGYVSNLMALKALELNNKEVKQMESKSRYEVIADLEAQKRQLIEQREGQNKILNEKKKELKELNRQVEDKEEEIKEFEESMESNKETLNTLITSVDDSLQRFGKIVESK